MAQPASILVTGASSGIGAALARGLAARGEPLVLSARRLDRLNSLAEELARRHGVAVQVVACDLARPDAVQALRAELRQRQIQLKGWVNSAGFGLRGPVESTDTAQLEALLRLTVQSMVELTSALLPELAQHPDAKILNVASLAGLVPGLAGSAVYSASKAFVIRFSQALAAEQGSHGVRVMVLCPGYVRSEFHAVLGVEDQMRGMPGWMWMEADELARQALNAWAGRAVVVVPGWPNRLIALLAHSLPEPLARELGRRFSSRYRQPAQTA
jgi:short-subunit dehydrogenase